VSLIDRKVGTIVPLVCGCAVAKLMLNSTFFSEAAIYFAAKSAPPPQTSLNQSIFRHIGVNMYIHILEGTYSRKYLVTAEVSLVMGRQALSHFLSPSV
jgi:hypothetical protein